MDNVNAVSPALIEAICRYLTQNGKYLEGIFRISPSRVQLTALRDRLRDEGEENLITDLANNAKDLDPHVVASLLKLLLGEFPEPLLSPLAVRVIDCTREPAFNFGNFDDAAVNDEIEHSFSSLSPVCQIIAEAILTMLYELVAFSNVTRMGPNQLSVVFAPALFGCPDTPESLSRFHQVTQLMHRLILKPLKQDDSPCDKRLEVESWLAVVRCVIRERFFSSSSEMRTDVTCLPQRPSTEVVVVHASDNNCLGKNITNDLPNSRININIDLSQPPVTDLVESPINFPEAAQLPSSSTRSVQLSRIAGVLCERFGITPDRKRQHLVSPVEEKIALQRALLQLEGSFGRPIDKAERQIVRPLYERYRELKRLAANAGTRNYRHHTHHEQRRHRHQFSSESTAVDGLDVADVRWATPSSNRFVSSGKLDTSAELVYYDPQKHQSTRPDKRRPHMAGRSDSLPADAFDTSPVALEEQPTIGEIKPQIALNSSPG